MRPKLAPGEKPLYWVGSSKQDLLEFPEAVKDAIGSALSVAQFGGKHPAAKPGRARGPVFWKSSRTIRAAPIARFTHFALNAPCTCCMPSRRSPPEALGRRGPTWSL